MDFDRRQKILNLAHRFATPNGDPHAPLKILEALEALGPTPEERAFFQRVIDNRRSLLEQMRRARMASPPNPAADPPDEPPPPRATPEDIAEHLLDEIRRLTPASRLYGLARSLDWERDSRDALKAYVLCCLSELAYLKLPHRSIDRAGRYKLLPNLMARRLAELGVRIDLEALFRSLELPAVVRERGTIIYAAIKAPGAIIVAVRGTKGYVDLATDITAQPLPRGLGPAYHLGFDAQATDALGEVVEAVDSHDKALPIYFTGHSLGGAIAAIFARRWPEPKRVRTPYIFGAPRYGNLAAVGRRPARAYVKGGDIVPRVPPRWMGYADADLHWITPKAERVRVVHHAIERYRGLLGRKVGQDFDDLAYLEALRRAVIGAADAAGSR